MKIKGVMGGTKKGTPIEYAPEEKVPLAVKDAVISKAPEGQQWWVEDGKISVTKSTFQSMGPRTDGKSFANNVYLAEGEVSVRPFDVKKDKLRPAVSKKFKIQFEDCCDHLGQPDLKVKTFELV